jgi:hypothetical protein
MLINAGDPCQWTYVRNLDKMKKTMVWYPSAFFVTGEISPRRQFLNQKIEN